MENEKKTHSSNKDKSDKNSLSKKEYRLEGSVSTCVVRPDKKQINGSILGNDGKYYRYRVPIRLEDVVKEGNSVSFVPSAGDRCYFANSIRKIQTNLESAYILPEGIAIVKNEPPKGMVILKTFGVFVCGSDRGSPANVLEGVKSLAEEIGINGLKGVRRFSTTGSEPGTGSGTHNFTIHNFYAQPCLLGIPTEQGGENPKKRITDIEKWIEARLEEDDEKEKEREENRKKKKTLSGIIVGALILTFVIGIPKVFNAHSFFNHEKLFGFDPFFVMFAAVAALILLRIVVQNKFAEEVRRFWLSTSSPEVAND